MVDFIGNNKQTEEQLKAKKLMKIVGVMLMLLFILCIFLVYMIFNTQNSELKISINDVSKKQLEEILIFEQDNIYIPIREFASYVGYNSYSGDYKQYAEDSSKCYVENVNEIASFTLDSNKIYKTDGKSDYQYFEIDKPVKSINGKLYTTVQGAQVAFNLQFSYNKEKNSIKIYTLPYLVEYCATQMQNANLTEQSFSNQKTILYNMIIVKNEYNHYGVNTLNGEEIIGAKYAQIEFIESTKEFIVKTDENKMGLMSSNGQTKIGPQYENIKQVDKAAGLYLATNNGKSGILDSNGNVVLYLEFEQIGIDTSKFVTNNIKNQYLLYDTCIPVKRNGLWGLYDKNGNKIVDTIYTALGCTAGSGSQANKTSNNVLLVPKYNAIVVQEGQLYGIIDMTGKKLIPSALTTVYSITTSGVDTYYMIYKENVMNVIDYLVKKEQKEQQTNQEIENEQTNQNVNDEQTQQTEQTNQTIVNEQAEQTNQTIVNEQTEQTNQTIVNEQTGQTNQTILNEQAEQTNQTIVNE